MAAHNIDMFEEGNSSSHTETTNSNTPPFTRLLRIVIAFLLAFWSTFPIQVEDESHSDLEEILTDRNRINSQKKLDPCESRCLCLKFSHEIAPVVFTGECLFPDGTKLELVDFVTGQQVRHGPLASSAQVEIFVLDNENWIIEELNNHIMMQTRGGTSRRDQNPYLSLEGGVVSVNEIKFKHTPKHMKKLNVVKLGARVVDQPEVIEAVTGPFTVKDKRSKSKKRYPPSPTDDVWRLEHIYKKGAFHNRLTENGIKTVEDFLIELQNNPEMLRHILGNSMSENYWKKVTTHAKTCNLDGRKYLYHHLDTEQKFTVAFDVAGQVMWLDSGCGLLHFNMLRDTQKAYAQKLVEIAFANWENVEKSDNEISINVSPSLRIGGMSRCHLGNLVTVDECQSLEFQNTSGTTETRWIDSAECSTSYAIEDRQSQSDEMSVAITSPGHSGLGIWGYQNSPNDITSAISESRDWEEFMQYLSSDETNNSAAETDATQFHGLQHGETMDLSQNQFMVSENVHTFITEDGTITNQQRQMNNVLMVPEASDKYKKSWIKICSILKWLELKSTNTCGTTESNWWIDSAECSTFADQQYESDEMSLAIPSPGHSGWGYLNSPNDITSAAISESGDWEEFIQFLSSDEIEFEDEFGQANNSVAETSSTHDETMDHLPNLKDSENVGTNANQQRQMNNVSLAPVGSTCTGKSKKGWTKICSILKWLSLKRFVKLKKFRMTKKRKLISK